MKPKTKKFNLEKAINQCKLVTKDGRDAKLVAIIINVENRYPLIVQIPELGIERFTLKGEYICGEKNQHDLLIIE